MADPPGVPAVRGCRTPVLDHVFDSEPNASEAG